LNEKKIWNKLLPRAISTERCKKELVQWMEARRPKFEQKGIRLPQVIEPRFFKRIWKEKDPVFRTTEWQRAFEFKNPLLFKGEDSPFWFIVHSNSEDTEITKIECLNS
jgi:hypothetical protein